MLNELIKYREFVFLNALHDMRLRYAGTAMGILWHIAQPLMLISLFSFVFSSLLPSRAGAGVTDYAIYLSAGLLPWLAFSDSIIRCSTSLVDNANFLKKVSVPQYLFVVRAGVGCGLLMFVSLALVIVAALFNGISPTWSWLTVPIAGLLMIIFGFGCGLILSPLHVFLRDTGQVVAMVTQLWMWLTPVIFVEALMPPSLQAAQIINPGAWFINAIRQPILNGTPASPMHWLLMILACVVSVMAGRSLLKKSRAEILDSI